MEVSPEEMYQEAADSGADIVIMFFGANVSKDYDALPERILYQASAGKRKRQVCEKYGDCYIPLRDIGEKDETHGMFNHPNDEGMREIAEHFWEYIGRSLL